MFGFGRKDKHSRRAVNAKPLSPRERDHLLRQLWEREVETRTWSTKPPRRGAERPWHARVARTEDVPGARNRFFLTRQGGRGKELETILYGDD